MRPFAENSDTLRSLDLLRITLDVRALKGNVLSRDVRGSILPAMDSLGMCTSLVGFHHCPHNPQRADLLTEPAECGREGQKVPGQNSLGLTCTRLLPAMHPVRTTMFREVLLLLLLSCLTWTESRRRALRVQETLHSPTKECVTKVSP